jgi:dienelactone hydrolase
MDQDVDEAMHWLRFTLPKDDQISIIGASVGANLALRAGTRHPRVKPIIMLSPGMQLWEVGITEAITEYENRPLLLVAAQDDAYPYDSVNQLYDPANDTHQLEIYPGAEHGTQLLNSHPELTALMLDWIEQNSP